MILMIQYTTKVTTKGILMFTKKFWIEASERAVTTLAQTFLALAGAESLFDAFVAD